MSETKRDNKALYQLRQEIEDCLTLEADEEFDLDELDMLILSFEEKVESCLAYIKNLQAAGEGLAAEIKRLQDQKRAVVNNMARLKGYVRGELMSLDRKKIRVGVHRCSVVKAPMSVEVSDPKVLPAEFQRVKIEARTADIIKHIKETGEVFNGVVIDDDAYYLRVN